MVDFSKRTAGDTVAVHVCDRCTINAGLSPKRPADSGVASWPCEVCGHYGIGSTMACVIGDWLGLRPVESPTPAAQESGDE